MPIRKVKQQIIFGGTLLQHYGADLSDVTTSSSSWTNWGQTIEFTPVEPDSHIEVVLTGSVFTDSAFTESGNRYGNVSLFVNGQLEHVQNGVIGGRTSASGDRYWHNPRHNQHNGRQQFHYYNFGNTVYMSHIYKPNVNNKLQLNIRVSCDNSQFNLNFKDGFMTVSELANKNFNLT